MEEKSKGKIQLWGILKPLGIGIIGSSIFFWGVKPLGNWIGVQILTTYSRFSQSGLNELYSKALSSTYQSYGGAEFYFFCLIVSLLLVFGFTHLWYQLESDLDYLQNIKSNISKDSELIKINNKANFNKKLQKLYFSAIIILLVDCSFCIFILPIEYANIDYKTKVYNWSKNSIVIVRPYISSREYYQLKSQLLQVDDAKEYYDFYDNIQKIAKENNLSLEKFKPIK